MKKLPEIFKPDSAYSLIRLGNQYDGGYLIGESTLRNSECLVSFGVALDISFEENFNNLTGKKVYLYDKLHFKYYFRDEFFLSLNNLRRLDFSKTINSIKKFLKIKKFVKNNTFNVKTITYNSLTEIINALKENKNVLLKIDIENSEYRLIDCLLKNQSKLSGLIIEFHDIDLHEKKILNFINAFELKLTHIHANNFAIPDKNGNPTVIELTFEREPEKISSDLEIPNKLDRKNNPLKKDFLNYI
ncbi:hypothetical protein [Candidatus Pelagibacter communis]|uniref:hypothetical protein n=1 Tax=Pelagibacter ubique TaxID=198252 RepID=UPI00094C1290|nr:hypothetical protein [Candidatus Pelagibacter ubique]